MSIFAVLFTIAMEIYSITSSTETYQDDPCRGRIAPAMKEMALAI